MRCGTDLEVEEERSLTDPSPSLLVFFLGGGDKRTPDLNTALPTITPNNTFRERAHMLDFWAISI